MNIPNKTLEDLEFDKVLHEVMKYAKTERVKKVILKTKPLANYKQAIFRLNATNEFLSGLQGENRFPFGDYDDIREDLEKLSVENYRMPATSFLAIRGHMMQIQELAKFLDTFQEYFPVFYDRINRIHFEKEILTQINQIFDRKGEIKDSASPELSAIRKQLKIVYQQLSDRFNGAMKANREYLADIGESLVDGKRVLAISAMHRKKVAGRFVGSSKTGSIAFIEPESVLKSQREYDELKEEEKNEIDKILRVLTALLAEFQPELISYQNFLFQLDLIASQAKYALEINGVLPNLNFEKKTHLINAYHPLLWSKHHKEGKEIHPQTISFDPDNRIMVISGPNAGGKSITLKTIGLLQLMMQSGILVPVHEKSHMTFYENIFTDIGDNQSIENQLSTYSYRLKQMQYFLQKSDAETFLLIDEFGTGSDPELGGALAEVFLEEFYEMQAYGVFTTHYSNIKILVENLEAATNASMLFDEKSLEPLFALEVGQAGSSFTFEVAQKNRIPFRLINRAKKKIERNKVRLDKTILKLQQEKHDIQKTKNSLKEIHTQSEEEKEQLEQTHEKIQAKLVDFQRLYEKEQRHIQLGKKIDELADQYHKRRSKRRLIDEFLKIVAIENSKKPEPKEHIKAKKIEKKVQEKLKQDLDKNADKIEEIQERIDKREKAETKKKAASLSINDRVRIKGSTSVGTVEKIEGKKVTINYGMFRTQIDIFEVDKI
ncbi:MAG: endonuclease MutS2 [Weeksellaceae bacterium]